MKLALEKNDKIFDIFNYILLFVLGLIALLPLLNVMAKSLSSEEAVISGVVKFLPIDFQVSTYRYVLEKSNFLNSFKVSVFITMVGTFLSMLLTCLAAYPLSKPGLRKRKLLIIFFIFTMLFSGGIVPDYLLIKRIGLLNKVWALIFPGMINVFNMLLVKNYFEGLPEEIEESARIDGASNTKTLIAIVLPISLPVIATISLYYAVAYWNDYFKALLYISDANKKPLQMYLFELLKQTQDDFLKNVSDDEKMNMTPDAVRATTVILSTIPIMTVYPFLQKHFVKGVIIGSVKG